MKESNKNERDVVEQQKIGQVARVNIQKLGKAKDMDHGKEYEYLRFLTKGKEIEQASNSLHLMETSCSQYGERKFKLVGVDGSCTDAGGNIIISSDHLPNHMATSTTPSQVNTILLDAASHVNQNQTNYNMVQLEADSLRPPSYSYVDGGGTVNKCLGGRRPTHEHNDFKVSHKECMKNHAASIGGYATDGCGEFMATSNGTKGAILETLNCSACNCHRNFHRKEVKPKHDHFQNTAASDASKFKD